MQDPPLVSSNLVLKMFWRVGAHWILYLVVAFARIIHVKYTISNKNRFVFIFVSEWIWSGWLRTAENFGNWLVRPGNPSSTEVFEIVSCLENSRKTEGSFVFDPRIQANLTSLSKSINWIISSYPCLENFRTTEGSIVYDQRIQAKLTSLFLYPMGLLDMDLSNFSNCILSRWSVWNKLNTRWMKRASSKPSTFHFSSTYMPASK